MSAKQEFKYIGRKNIRPDAPDKLTGRALYGDDLTLPGMLHGRVLRSPHAHARILSIDTSAAEAMDGVMAVATSADLQDMEARAVNVGEQDNNFKSLTRNILAREKALYHGHAVAAVAARTPALAGEALEKIKVEWEVLPAVMDAEAALAKDSPVIMEGLMTKGLAEEPTAPSNLAEYIRLERGSVEDGMAAADVIVEKEYRTGTVHQGYIEPHACTARYDESGHSTIWTCTQGHFDVRAMVARLLGMAASQIKVTASEIGGGFGGKTTIYLEPVAMILSRKSGRPVNMVMSREEVFRASGPASASVNRIRIGAKRDGTITAMQASLTYEAGAYPGSAVRLGCMCVTAPYAVENLLVEGRDVLVNKPKVAAYRAPGAPQAAHAMECAVNELADRLNMDPIDLRLKNAVKAGDRTLYGANLKAVGLIECLQEAKNSPHYQAAMSRDEGRGVATGFWFNAGMQSAVTLNMNADGTAVIVVGSVDLAGTRLAMVMMAAEELGIPPERISINVADTESVATNSASSGSRTVFATGMAVVEASRQLITDLRNRAARMLEVSPEEVEWQDGSAVHDDKILSTAEICAAAARTGGPISASASLTARGAGPGFAVHVADVRVDQETGRPEVTRYTAVQDAGRAINPPYVEGQFQGGAVQGIGWALNEEYIYNEEGVMENAGFLDYRMPLTSDLPMIETVIVEVPNPFHPYGVRGIGESSIVPAPAATATAVSHAIGVPLTTLPCSPPRVLAAIMARDGNPVSGPG